MERNPGNWNGSRSIRMVSSSVSPLQLAESVFYSESGVLFLILSSLIALFACVSFRFAFARNRLPPAPVAFPVIGHLHYSKLFSHRGLYNLSERYGPIFFLRLGSMPAVIVSSAALAKEFLHHHDEAFAHRPHMAMRERLLYGNSASILMDYNARWREIRALYTQVVLSPKSVRLSKQARDEEIARMVCLIEQKSGSGVQLRPVLFELTVNILSRALFSRRADGRFAVILDLVAQIVELFLAPIIGDFIPYLKWFDPGGYLGKLDFAFQRWDALLDGVVTERLKEMQEGTVLPNDMLNALLDFNNRNVSSDRRVVKAALLELLAAGTETTTTTVEWVMAELLLNPMAMKKLQEELDQVVGRGRQVDDTDVPKAHYLRAVMTETWRLHPPVPLLLPHLTKEETKVAGYVLPKNTRLMVNVWAIGRDGERWREAEEFRPERFMRGGEAEGKDVKGRDYDLLPFGTGRRGCPGIHLAMAVATLSVANLVHRFDWRVAAGSSIRMDDTLEITARLAYPPQPIPTPR